MSSSSACATVRARLSPYLDGRLGARTELVVRRHLAGCPECRTEWRRARVVGAAVGRLSFAAPVGLAQRVRRTERRRARTVAVRHGVARASAALVVVCAAAFAGLAGVRAVRGPAPVTPAATVAAPTRIPSRPRPAGLQRVAGGPALADWAGEREVADAAVWLARDDADEASGPPAPPGATAGFRAPR